MQNMYVPELDQEMAVLGVAEAESLIAEEPGRWNVISIVNDPEETPSLSGARKLLRLVFDDIDGTWDEAGGVLATEDDVLRAIAFAKKTGRQPLLIHCTAGVSRSTAIAWTVVYARLCGAPRAGHRALGIVRRIRPICLPNRHILRLSINLLAKHPDERQALQRELASVL